MTIFFPADFKLVKYSWSKDREGGLCKVTNLIRGFFNGDSHGC